MDVWKTSLDGVFIAVYITVDHQLKTFILVIVSASFDVKLDILLIPLACRKFVRVKYSNKYSTFIQITLTKLSVAWLLIFG